MQSAGEIGQTKVAQIMGNDGERATSDQRGGGATVGRVTFRSFGRVGRVKVLSDGSKVEA